MNYLSFKTGCRFLLCFALALSLAGKLLAQAPPIVWQRCYGGDSTDYINCIRQTADSGYIAIGDTRSIDGDLAGNGGAKGIWVLKLDPLGNIQWERTYNDTLTGGSYIEPTTDGGYALTGNHTIKLDNDGNIDTIVNIAGRVIHQTSDGGYILCSYGGVGITKLNPDFSVAWSQDYDSFEGDYFSINDVVEVPSGFVVTGGIMDIFWSPFVASTDTLGNFSGYIPDDNGHGMGEALCKLNNGDFLFLSIGAGLLQTLSGFGVSNLNTSHLYISGMSATSDNGGVVCGGTGNEFGYSVTDSFSDLSVVKYDSAGNRQWTKNMGGSSYQWGNSVLQGVGNGNYVAAGVAYSNNYDVSGNHGMADGWVVMIGTNDAVPGVVRTVPEIAVYPLPAAGFVNVVLPQDYGSAQLRLLDVSGGAIPVNQSVQGLTRVLNLDGLAPGAYLLQVIDKGVYTDKKIIHY